MEGLPVTKYQDASAYIKDLKVLDSIYNMSISTSKQDLIEADKMIKKMSNEKVIAKLHEGDILASFAESVKNILIAKSFYECQQYILKKHSENEILDTCYYNPFDRVDPMNYSLTNLTNVSLPGIDYVMDSEDSTYELDYISTDMSNTTLSKIESNGGYAIVISYYNAEDSKNWDTYWYVGFEVSVDTDDNGLKYKITKYSDNESDVISEMTLSEALNYDPINIS